jgi:ankyrin repeat protein
MKKHFSTKTLLIYSILSCPVSAATEKQTIEILNHTDLSVNANVPIPEHTKALIELTKLNLPYIQEALYKAILNNSAEEVRQAIFLGADVNHDKEGKTPLLFAILLKCSKAVEALLECGAKKDTSYLQHSIRLRDIESIFLLLENINELTAVDINNLARHDHANTLTCIHKLIKYGYDVNNLWHDCITAYYSQKKHEAVINLLLKNGANPNHIIDKGSISTTPLFMAIAHNNASLVNILLGAGANITQKINTPQGLHTPLSYAICHSRKDVVELLTQRGASLN